MKSKKFVAILFASLALIIGALVTYSFRGSLQKKFFAPTPTSLEEGVTPDIIYEAAVSPEGRVTSIKAHFRQAYGRLRAIQIGPDGYFYISTSNTDGRGEPRPGDDKIIRINPEKFL